MTINTIFVNQNTPDTCYFTGDKPYPKPQIAHPILRSSLHSKNNHELVFRLNGRARFNWRLQVIFITQRNQPETYPERLCPHLQEKTTDLSILWENKLYQGEVLQSLLPRHYGSFHHSSKHYRLWDQTKERDNRLTFSIM